MNQSSRYDEMVPIYTAQPRSVAFYLCIKRLFFRFCKIIGLFHIADRLTRRGLRIICYHGFSIADESLFSGRTFINPNTFERRLALVKRNGFRVIGLGEALNLLDRDALPPRSVVITIDDGFDSVYSQAYPILKRYGFSATVYVTTYYMIAQNPVFNLAVQYLFWKTASAEVDITGLGLPKSGIHSLRREEEKTALLGEIIRFGEERCDEVGRVALALALAKCLGVDYDAVIKSRILTIMSPEQVNELSVSGFDIQLHTHRHVFPLDHNRAIGEIRDNRAVLEALLGKKLVHFCYPAGFWAREQWPWLAEAAIQSAVTCDTGFNDKRTPRYGLKRFGDDEYLSHIEFEAELCGFAEMLRVVKRRFRFL